MHKFPKVSMSAVHHKVKKRRLALKKLYHTMYLIFQSLLKLYAQNSENKDSHVHEKDQLLNLQEQEPVWLLELQFYRSISANVKVCYLPSGDVLLFSLVS